MSTQNFPTKNLYQEALEFISTSKAIKNQDFFPTQFRLSFTYIKQLGGNMQLTVSLTINNQILVEMEFINTKERMKISFEKLVFNCQKYNDEHDQNSYLLFVNTGGNVRTKFVSQMNDFMRSKIQLKNVFDGMEKMFMNFIFYSPPKEIQENKFSYLKYVFELRRRKRQRSTKMGVHLYEKNLQCDIIDQLYEYKVEGKLKNKDRVFFKRNYLQKIQQEYEEVEKRIYENFTQEIMKKQKIVNQIQILKRKENEKELYANMGLITLCNCQFVIKKCQQETKIEPTAMLDQSQEEKLVEVSLIKKTINPKQKENSAKSFENEKLILQKMKRFSFPRIASYYTQDLANIRNEKQVFSKYYPKSFQEEKDYLKIAKQLAQALYFFNFMKILHRDLKDSNIKVDEEGNLKIIDFGSAVPNINNPNIQQFDLIMRSTPHYQLRYKDLPTSVRKIYEKEDYERHQFFDLYSYGKILESCVEKMEEENTLKEGLRYISKKSMESNPQDRLSPIEILGFLQFFPFKN